MNDKKIDKEIEGFEKVYKPKNDMAEACLDIVRKDGRVIIKRIK